MSHPVIVAGTRSAIGTAGRSLAGIRADQVGIVVAQCADGTADIANRHADILAGFERWFIGHAKTTHIEGGDVEAGGGKRGNDIPEVEPPAERTMEQQHQRVIRVASGGGVQADAARVQELVLKGAVKLHYGGR